jgi:hypothetical protein
MNRLIQCRAIRQVKRYKNSQIRCNGEVFNACTSWEYSYPGIQGDLSTSTSGGSTTAAVSVPANVQVRVTTTVQIPNWTGYSSASSQDKAKWDQFKDDLRNHEQGHVNIANNGITTVRNALLSAKSTATANSKQAAITQAAAGFHAALQRAFAEGMAVVQARSDFYDLTTAHGLFQSTTPMPILYPHE